MTYLLVEIFALMLAAFLAGAIVACTARKLFAGRSASEPAVQAFEFTPPAPSPVSTSKASSAADRFAAALTGSGSRPAVDPQPDTAAASPHVIAAAPAPIAAEPQPSPIVPKPAARTDFTPVAAAAAALERARAAIAEESAASTEPVLSPGVMSSLITTPAETVAAQPVAAASEPERPVPIDPPIVETASIEALAAAPEPVSNVTEPTGAPQTPPPAVLPSARGFVLDGEGDDLTRIRSINALTQSQLNELGVYRYEQIARWTVDDVKAVNAALMGYGRVERENWIEQAALLARGSDTEYARNRIASVANSERSDHEDHDIAPVAPQLVVPDSASALRPARLEEAIRDNEARAAPQQLATRSEFGPLRSIRSEALASAHGLVNLEPGQSPDDLKRIRGIGVLVEKKLNSLAITSYEQIANWTDQDIERVSRFLDFQGRIERENWVEQARMLVAESADVPSPAYLN